MLLLISIQDSQSQWVNSIWEININFSPAPNDIGDYDFFDKSVVKTSRSSLTINQTADYMGRGFMIFMQGVDITWGIGRILLKVEPVLGPEIV